MSGPRPPKASSRALFWPREEFLAAGLLRVEPDLVRVGARPRVVLPRVGLRRVDGRDERVEVFDFVATVQQD